MILLQDAKDEGRGKGRDTEPVTGVEHVVVDLVVEPAWRTSGVRFPTRLQGHSNCREGFVVALSRDDEGNDRVRGRQKDCGN